MVLIWHEKEIRSYVVLKLMFGIFETLEKTIQEMESSYKDIEVSYEFADAVAMRLIQSPNMYDVLVTANLFGDILTDEASVISGSMGLMPSALLVQKLHCTSPFTDLPSSSRKKYCKSNCNNSFSSNDV